MTDPAKTFDAYEIIGVMTPGAVLALLMALRWPEFRALLGQDAVSVGGLGLFVVASFVIGHMVQAVGNLVETLFWALPGLPSTWVRSPNQTLLTTSQRHQLEAKVTALEPEITDLADVKRKAWLGVTARLYGQVSAGGRAGRIDVCNRTYGLSRGLAAAFLIGALWSLYDNRSLSPQALVFFGLTVVALYRMLRSGRQYARALFLAYLDLPTLALRANDTPRA
jgi:hypothetical protein